MNALKNNQLKDKTTLSKKLSVPKILFHLAKSQFINFKMTLQCTQIKSNKMKDKSKRSNIMHKKTNRNVKIQ